MPEPLKKSEVEKGQDPTVAKQWDDETPADKKFEDFYKIADGLKIGMMGTLRNGVGVCPIRAVLPCVDICVLILCSISPSAAQWP